jgi:hypothetical protein
MPGAARSRTSLRQLGATAMFAIRQGLMIGALFCFSLCSAAGAQEPELPKPGPEHEMLAELAGTWDGKMKTGDGMPESKGTMTYTVECGGMWLASSFEGDFGGMMFQGRGLDGYDPQTKKFVGVWVDSMGTRPMQFEGDYDADSKTMTMHATGPGPGGQPAKWKSVTVKKDADHHTFQMFLTPEGGEEMLMLSIEYTRRQ